MEDMRAVYQLNEETLDTNLKVLKERQKVNTSYITMLRSKERKYMENFRKQSKQYTKENFDFKKENVQLTEDYKRIT